MKSKNYKEQVEDLGQQLILDGYSYQLYSKHYLNRAKGFRIVRLVMTGITASLMFVCLLSGYMGALALVNFIFMMITLGMVAFDRSILLDKLAMHYQTQSQVFFELNEKLTDQLEQDGSSDSDLSRIMKEIKREYHQITCQYSSIIPLSIKARATQMLGIDTKRMLEAEQSEVN